MSTHVTTSSVDTQSLESSSEPTSTQLLGLRGISKRFSGVRALSHVDLDLKEGEILALLGENGAGKSTLMKILSGVHIPDTGEIHYRGESIKFATPGEAQDAGISIIYQEFSLLPALSAYENIAFGREPLTRWGTLDRAKMKKDAAIQLARLGIKLDVTLPVSQLSIAEQQFVEIAKALARSARILILDEPTATLTPNEVDRLFAVMRELRRSRVAMIFISHHLEEIFQIADRVQCLRDGKSVGTMPVADCTPEGLVKMIAGRDITHAFPPRADRAPGKIVLSVKNLQRRRHLPALTFEVREGEILGFAGLIGSGRTEVIRAVIGADRAYARELELNGKPFSPSSPADALNAGIGLLPEDRKQQGLVLPFSVMDNLVLANLRAVSAPITHRVSNRRSEPVVQEYIKSLRIKTPSSQQIVRNLSGGNQQKVVIAKWLHADCRVLIFDEPTRGIDVGAKSEIYDLMRKLTAQGVAIIMISSELPEVVGMSDRVIVMRQHRVEKTLERAEDITAETIMYYATGGHHA